MATVADLVEFFAEMTGTRPEEGRVRARHLREAGLLPSTGRGRGGAHINSTHCASYLIGWLAADRAVNAPEAVRMAGQLFPAEVTGSLDDFPDHAKRTLFDSSELKEVGNLRALYHSILLDRVALLECVSALIEFSRTNEGDRINDRYFRDLKCARNWPYAQIRFIGDSGVGLQQSYRISKDFSVRSWINSGLYKINADDFISPIFVTAETSHHIIGSLSELIGGSNHTYASLREIANRPGQETWRD